jgi:hypothetical protein
MPGPTVPSFPDQLDVSIDRGTAQYAVRSQVGAQGKEEVLSGQVELPRADHVNRT